VVCPELAARDSGKQQRRVICVPRKDRVSAHYLAVMKERGRREGRGGPLGPVDQFCDTPLDLDRLRAEPLEGEDQQVVRLVGALRRETDSDDKSEEVVSSDVRAHLVATLGLLEQPRCRIEDDRGTIDVRPRTFT